MRLKSTKLYPYRIFTHSHCLMALLPCSTLEEVWKEINKNPILYFIFPDKNGNTIEAAIKADSITVVDRPYGTEPVSQKEGPEKVGNVSNRAVMRQGKIVIGQQAKREKK